MIYLNRFRQKKFIKTLGCHRVIVREMKFYWIMNGTVG